MPDALYYNHREGGELVCTALKRVIERLRRDLATDEAISSLFEDPEGVRAVDKLLNTKTEDLENWVEKARERGNSHVAHVGQRMREVHELKKMFEQDTAPDTTSVQKARMIIHHCMLYEATQLMDSYGDEGANPRNPEVTWIFQSMVVYAKAMNMAFADFPGDTWTLYPLDSPPHTA